MTKGDIFVQAAPMLGNQYRDDAFLRSYLQRKVPASALAAMTPELDELGAIAGGELIPNATFTVRFPAASPATS